MTVRRSSNKKTTPHERSVVGKCVRFFTDANSRGWPARHWRPLEYWRTNWRSRCWPRRSRSAALSPSVTRRGQSAGPEPNCIAEPARHPARRSQRVAAADSLRSMPFLERRIHPRASAATGGMARHNSEPLQGSTDTERRSGTAVSGTYVYRERNACGIPAPPAL